MKEFSRKKRASGLESLFFFLLSVVIVFLVFSTVNLLSLERHFFNSDTLYLPSIYQDFFIDRNNFSDFNFNPAPNFFPDMGLHFILMKLFSNDFKLVAFIFSILQLFSVLFLLKKIGELLNLKNTNIIYTGLGLLLLFFLPSIVSNDFLFSFYFLINSYHLGSFVMTMLLMLLVYKSLFDRSLIRSLSIFILVVLSYISDQSILMNFILPTILSIVIYFFFNKEKKGTVHYRWVFFMIVLGTFIGALMLRVNNHFGWLLMAKKDVVFDFQNSLRSITYFYDKTINYLCDFSFVSLIISLSIVSYLSYGWIIIKEYKKGISFLELQLFLMITFILFTPVFIGKITGLDSIRYNYHGMILLVFLFPYLMSKLFLSINTKYMNTTIVAFLLIPLIFSFSKINYNGISSYLNLYPKEVSTLDNRMEELGLKNGLATYWKAKKTTMFSKKNLKVYCIYEDLKVYRHVTNRTWYYNDVLNKGNPPIYNFFIYDNEIMKANILEQFPNAKVIKINNTLSIIKTKDFTFSQLYEIIVL